MKDTELHALAHAHYSLKRSEKQQNYGQLTSKTKQIVKEVNKILKWDNHEKLSTLESMVHNELSYNLPRVYQPSYDEINAVCTTIRIRHRELILDKQFNLVIEALNNRA